VADLPAVRSGVKDFTPVLASGPFVNIERRNSAITKSWITRGFFNVFSRRATSR